MTGLNVNLLRQTMDYIDSHPEEHRQAHWGISAECGTTACFAGWATMLDNPANVPPTAGVIWMVGQGTHVSEHAAGILGVSEDQADALFSASHDRNELRAIVAELIKTGGSSDYDDLMYAARSVRS